MDILTRITEVEVNDKLYFRVLSSPQRERDAREVIRVAKQTGYRETWYFAEPLLSFAVADVPESTRAASTTSASTGRLSPAPRMLATITDHETLASKTHLTMDGQSGNISRFDGTQIRIDGIIDESVWQQITPFDRLRVLNPDTLEPGQHETQPESSTTTTESISRLL